MAENDPTIGWVLDRAALVAADRPATVDRGTGERRTWSETAERVRSVATALGSFDLDQGDRVGVLMLNSARHFELWFAIPAAGMVMNDLNYRLAAEELAFICNDSDVKLLFVDDNFLPVAQQLLDQVDSLEQLVWVGAGDAPDELLAYDVLAATDPGELPTPASEDLAAIFYTGGTTGLPKGAMLTHRNLTANALHMALHIRATPADSYLHAGPQFHLADGSMSFALTWVGATHVFLPAFEPKAVVDALAEEQVTISLLVPTMIAMVLGSGALADADVSALRVLMYGASPMAGELQRQAFEQFGCDMVQAYGMTEASPLVTWLDEETHRRGAAGEEPHATRLRSAGVPVVGVRAEVRREDGVTPAPPGEPGEIYIQGPNIMVGYWNRDEETTHALVDGWYRSGDVAYADESGYLYVVDRAKDMIISGGENVYTSEVENAVYAHPSVAEAAVFGIPHDDWGETVHVEVVLKPGAELTDDELVAECRKHIAGYKLPRSVRIRPAEEPLPKSGAGKILKRDLREPYWEGHDRRVG